jgi:1D-myo-inositol 3-kinase
MQLVRGSTREPVVVIAGHVTHDRTPGGVVAGGPAYHGAHTYRGLGASPRLVTAVGHDFAGDDAIGVPAEIRRGGSTTELAGGRLAARAQPVLAVDLPEAWRRCDVLHLAPVLAEVDLARWAQIANARLVAISVNGWTSVPGPDNTVVRRRWDIDRRGLMVVDVACVSERDLLDQGDLLDRLIGAVPIIAVTRGALGADVIVRGGSTRVGTYRTDAVDLTAAGPAFAAGFFYGIARGLAPIEAAQLAAASASIVIEGRGMAGLPEAWQRARQVPAGRAPAELRSLP